MNRFSALLTGMALWVAAVCGAHAQAITEWMADENLPDPPTELVKDDASLFTDPEIKRRISESLLKLKKDHNFTIYLLVEPMLIGFDPQMMAERLQQKWLPQGNGLVIVYETDSRSMGLGRGFEVDGTPPGTNLATIPSHEMVVILNQALQAQNTELPIELYVETLALDLAKNYRDYFESRQISTPKRQILKTAIIGIGGLAMLSLCAIILGIIVKWADTRASIRMGFPEVEVSERLGAPFGGGNVSVRRFLE